MNTTSKIDPAVNAQMFGCDPYKVLDYVLKSDSYKRNGAISYAASMLSDAQELIAMGNDDAARQQINLVKFILFEIADGNLTAVVDRAAA